MTREEEIKQAANESLCGDKSYISSYEEKGFIDGAEWADENPDENRIAKFLYEKKGYPIDMNGNLPSFDETMKDVEKYLKYTQDQFIDKACTWLKDRAESFVVNTPLCYYDYKQAVEDFKNYMKVE